MRGQSAVYGDCRPVVFEHIDLVRTFRYHRFYGQCHAPLKARSLAGPAVIWYLRVFVHTVSDTVTHKISYHSETFGFDRFLDRM